MEIVTELANNQLFLYVPVALAIFGAILVFTFGFKSAEQPPFVHLSLEDRKNAGKKRKIKEKKPSANGHISTGESKSDKSPSKEKSPVKETKKVLPKESVEPKNEKKDKKDSKQVDKTKKSEPIKKSNIEELKNKKNLKKLMNEKPSDFDDGNWETVPTKADKKKKSDLSPAKTERKSKKNDKADIEKIIKDAVNKELKEKEVEPKVVIEDEKVEEMIEEPVEVVEEKKEKKPKEEKVVEELVAVVEEKKEKKKEKKPKKEKEEKPEKPKEIIEEIELPKEPIDDQKKNKAPQEDENEAKEVSIPTGPAFDELGDTWTEAKAVKKSKKKARRDN